MMNKYKFGEKATNGVASANRRRPIVIILVREIPMSHTLPTINDPRMMGKMKAMKSWDIQKPSIRNVLARWSGMNASMAENSDEESTTTSRTRNNLGSFSNVAQKWLGSVLCLLNLV